MTAFTGDGMHHVLSVLEESLLPYARFGDTDETRAEARRVLDCLQGIKRDRLEAAMRKATR